MRRISQVLGEMGVTDGVLGEAHPVRLLSHQRDADSERKGVTGDGAYKAPVISPVLRCAGKEANPGEANTIRLVWSERIKEASRPMVPPAPHPARDTL